ncbi:MAG TPA: AMP-binding protein [Nevskiaceae bacterium]|nr:AMP-binding protein [Nevskiaceae bacterium]
MSFDVTHLDHRRATNRWERASVGDLLERVTYSYPDKIAIVGWPGAYAHADHARLSYRQADEISARIANALLARGLKRSDRVLMFCENSVEAYLFKLGVARAGLVCAPLNPSLASDVVTHLIQRTEPAFSIVDAELWPRIEAVFAALNRKPDVMVEIGGTARAGSLSLADFIKAADTAEPEVEIHGDDIWEILFTSGTTAMPKGVMLSHHSTYYATYSFALTLTRGLHLECDLVLASFLPLIYHSGDQIFALSPFLCGGRLVIGRKPDAVGIATAITREGVTALWGGSPAMVNALAKVLREDRLAYDPRSLKVVVYGWASIPPGTLATLKQLCGAQLVGVEIFGQTESISCHRFWADKWPDTYRAHCPQSNYVGVPNPLLASRVVNADGHDVTPGDAADIGEAVYRSPAITAGYYRDEAATREAFRDGWFHSGDSCIVDADGLRVMVDRSKDIVKSGGENVSSLRVEAILAQHPAVAKVAVIGLPHQRWGEAVTAIVVPAEGATRDADALIRFCRDRLAGFETPKRVLFIDDLPATVGGKVLKYKLRQRYATAYGDER